MNQEEQKKPAAQEGDQVTDLMSDFGRRPAPAPKKEGAPKPAAEKAPEPPKKAPSPAPKQDPTPKKAAEAPKKAPAKKPDIKKEKTADQKNDGKKPSERAQATTATPKKSKAEKAEKQTKQSDDRLPSSRPGHKAMPYLLGALAIFIGICLLLNLFCNSGNKLADTPEEHWMGLVGYYISYVLFGLFGAAVFALPILIGILAFSWKRYADRHVLLLKTLALLLSVLSLASLIHVCNLITLPSHMKALSAGDLMFYGAKAQGGGLLGGGLGYLLYSFARYVGGILISALILAVSLFCFLGLTPKELWCRFREKRQEKKEKKQRSLSLTEAEHAKYQAEMDEKFRRAKNEEPSAEGDIPVGGVRVVEGKKTMQRDRLAPMPTPKLDPNDGSRPFIPSDVKGKLRQGAAPTPVAGNGQHPAPTPAPTPASAPVAPQTAKETTHQNRDVAVDPIFPKGNEQKMNHKVPKEERNFDLKNIFIDLDDTPASPAPRKHAEIPPEVPMSGSARPAARPQTPPKTAAAVQKTATPTAKPAASAAPAAPAAKGAVPGAKKPAGAGPVFRQADKQKQEFGLDDEAFEKLEAQKNGTPAPAKKPASKAPAKAKTAEKPKEPEQKYVFPPVAYLQPGVPMTAENRAEIEDSMQMLATTLASFNVRVQEINYSCGPTVTRYEVILAPGVRVRTVTNLSNDIALALRSPGGVRIEAPIPGTNAVGIEVPNKTRSTIYLRDLIENKEFMESKSKLTSCLGSDIAGQPVYFDISKMPHLLIAGTTGSGKSVCINCIIMSLLYKVRPDEVKLVLVDPKKVEFSIYKNIPHLMAPVVTLPKDAAGALQASVEEMERRFEVFESVGVRDIKGYNEVTADDPDMPYMPHIVIIIDELADLMMTAKNEVETAICRIAQKARAAGMHLIIGTQRPSADVVTGLIKANVPSSIAFAVKSQIDSRVILDHGGAEALTGKGDMLFVPIGSMRDTRIQGAFVADKEVEKICEFIRAANGTAQYDEKFITKLKELAAQCGKAKGKGDDLPPVGDGEKVDDPKYNDAVRVAIEEGKISTSLLQRKLEIGYSRAAKIIDRMQAEGIVSPPDGSKPRSILISKDEYLERFFGENTEE